MSDSKVVDEHIYRRMEEVIWRIKALQSTVARLIDLQVMMGYNLDRLLHTDGSTIGGPILDPED